MFVHTNDPRVTFACMYNATLPPYWTKVISDHHLQHSLSVPAHWDAITPVTSLLLHMHQQCDAIIDFCHSYDAELQQRLSLQVGQEYALVASLVHRQVTGAMALVWLQEFEQPLAFMKEVKRLADSCSVARDVCCVMCDPHHIMPSHSDEHWRCHQHVGSPNRCLASMPSLGATQRAHARS